LENNTGAQIGYIVRVGELETQMTWSACKTGKPENVEQTKILIGLLTRLPKTQNVNPDQWARKHNTVQVD